MKWILLLLLLVRGAFATYCTDVSLTCLDAKSMKSQCCGLQPTDVITPSSTIQTVLNCTLTGLAQCQNQTYSLAEVVNEYMTSVSLESVTPSVPYSFTCKERFSDVYVKLYYPPINTLLELLDVGTTNISDYCDENWVTCADTLIKPTYAPRIDYPTPGYKMYPCEFSHDHIDMSDSTYGWKYTNCYSEKWYTTHTNGIAGLMIPATDLDVYSIMGLSKFQKILIDSVSNIYTGIPTTLTQVLQNIHSERVTYINTNVAYLFNTFSNNNAWVDVEGGSGPFGSVLASASQLPVAMVSVFNTVNTGNDGTDVNAIISTFDYVGNLNGFSLQNVTLPNPSIGSSTLTFSNLLSPLQIMRLVQMDLTYYTNFTACSANLPLVFVNVSNNVVNGLIVDDIVTCPTLQVLDLSYNYGVALQAGVLKSSSLRYLDLSYSGVSGNLTSFFQGASGYLRYLGLNGLANTYGSLPASLCARKVGVDTLTPRNSNASLGLCSLSASGCGPLPPCA